jgi:hypothetical protein
MSPLYVTRHQALENFASSRDLLMSNGDIDLHELMKFTNSNHPMEYTLEDTHRFALALSAVGLLSGVVNPKDEEGDFVYGIETARELGRAIACVLDLPITPMRFVYDSGTFERHTKPAPTPTPTPIVKLAHGAVPQAQLEADMAVWPHANYALRVHAGTLDMATLNRIDTEIARDVRAAIEGILRQITRNTGVNLICTFTAIGDQS